MFRERRLEPREPVALPLKLADGCSAITRDISPSGMYLRILGERTIEGIVYFEMDLAEAQMRFSAEAQIVRIERKDGHTGIAVRLISPRLEILD
jgi:hypothetical protein